MRRGLNGLPKHFTGANPFLPEGPDENAGGGGGKVEEGKPDDGKADKGGTYTPPASQDELNRIVSERLTRDRAKYADYDDLKKKAAEHDKAVEAARSEHEKAVEAARKEGESGATEKANGRLVAAEARALAAEAKFRSPSLAIKGIDLSEVKVNDSGEVDAAAIKALLKTLAEDEPYLVEDGKVIPKPDKSQGARDSSKTTGVNAGRDMFVSSRTKSSTEK